MTREDLKSYYRDNDELNRLEEYIEELSTDIENITSKISDMPSAQSNIQDKTAEKICKLINEKENFIMKKIELTERKIKIYTSLMQMTGVYRDILELKYIKGKKLVEIAVEKGYNYDYVRQKHGKALCVFDKINAKK